MRQPPESPKSPVEMFILAVGTTSIYEDDGRQQLGLCCHAMRFEFAMPTRIIFGPGTAAEVGTLAKLLGKRALVVSGSTPQRAGPLLATLQDEGINGITFPVSGEPEVQTVQDGVVMAKQEGCDIVVAIGGGSALDAGKAIAALMTNGGDLLDYLEIIGRGKPLSHLPAPFIAIPTTAGTGSEVTRNSVLASPEHRLKVSLRSPLMPPKIALVDPELTLDLPPALTASTGLDALTQLIEPFVCARANPATDAVCREGLDRAARSLRVAFENGRDPQAREDMAVASLFGGLALSNAGLGAVHGLAGPMGGMFNAPHGAICAALLPIVMEANITALELRQPTSEALVRYEKVARHLTGDAAAAARDGVEWVRRLAADLEAAPLGQFGIAASHITEIVEKAANASSMKANPIVLTPDELAAVVQQAL
jgi:alcohol dehydrogenase class IV